MCFLKIFRKPLISALVKVNDNFSAEEHIFASFPNSGI